MTDPASSAATPVRLTTEHATTPLDVAVQEPRLAWQLDGDRAGVVQEAYQIVVATDPALLAHDRADVWDSGQVRSPDQANVPYAGPPLAANATYFWAVRTWRDASGEPGAWSEPARFETGLFSPSDWSAVWIGRDEPAETPVLGTQPPAPLLRKEFVLDGDVVRARLRVSGLGWFVASLNGARVGDALLDPPPTVYDETALYATHDVTALLRRGANALGVVLGRGYFGAPKSQSSFELAKARWRSEPRLLAQLDVTYRDGRTARVVSDASWRTADGPARDSAWDGEHHDARLEQPGWDAPGFDASSWTPAPEQPAPARAVRAIAMEPVRIAETLDPVAVTTPSSGVAVYDFGRVVAGWARIAVRGAAGTTVTLTYGETLLRDGTVATLGSLAGPPDPARTPDPVHVDSYTLRGAGDESWEPSFTRHGFRFVQVSFSPAEPASFAVQARVNHSDVASTGRFTSASDLVNRLHANQRASLLANLWGFPTDTPWRDRMGWTADAWLMLDSALLNFDVRRLYAQWLRTYRESQRADGALPVIAPSVPLFGAELLDDPSWSGTIVLDAWALYQHHGDVRVLADGYDAMARWLDRMARAVAATGHVHRGFSFGDWVAPGTEADGNLFLQPPEGPALSATADLYLEARTLARIASLLGRDGDAARFDAFAARTAAAFEETFYDAAAGMYRTERDAGYRQTSQILPLAYGLVPGDRADAIYARLVDDLRARGDRLDTGAVGTKQLLPLLTARGDGELAWALLTQTAYPSWGYWITQGATTSWETWSQTGPQQSLNHAFVGTFDEWLYTGIAGIRATTPGYASVRIAPFVPAALEHASASIDTPRGTVASSWRRDRRTLVLEVAIPGNVAAEIRVPADASDEVDVAGDGGVRLLRRERGHAVYASGSGRHAFTVRARMATLPRTDAHDAGRP